MRAWFVGVTVGVVVVVVVLGLAPLLPSTGWARSPCRAHCRRQGHLCKDRCRARAPYDWHVRRACLRGCRAREARCKLRCPY